MKPAIERIRPGAIISLDDTRPIRVPPQMRTALPTSPVEDEVSALRRQLRRAVEKNSAAFDQGFQACVAMVEAGADLARLREASGVVYAEFADTSPTELEQVDPTEPFELNTFAD